MRIPRRLSQWLERTQDLDREELYLEWTRITPADILMELSGMLAADDAAGLVRLHEQLQDPDIREFFRFSKHPSTTGRRRLPGKDPARDRIDLLRQHDVACGMTSTAVAALTTLHGEATELTRWIDVAARAWCGLDSEMRAVECTLDGAIDPAAELDAGLLKWNAMKPTCGIGAARAWASALCREWRRASDPEGTTQPSFLYTVLVEQSIRWLVVRSDGIGVVCRLHVARMGSGTGDVYPQPERLGLTPMSDEFLATAGRAWQEAAHALTAEEREAAARHDYAWWLTGSAFGGDDAPVLGGGSHGAALAIALALSMKSMSADPDFAITGSIGEGGRIGPVGGVREKARAVYALRDAAGRPSIPCLVVAEDNVAPAREAATEAGLEPDHAVLKANTILDVLTEASGLPEQFRRFCRLEMEDILAQASLRIQRPLGDWQALCELRVPMLVERVIRKDPDQAAGGITVQEAWDQIAPDLQRAFLVGEPGAGKTALLWQEVGRRCRALLSEESAAPGLAALVAARQLSAIIGDGPIDDLPGHLAAFLVDRRGVKDALRAALVGALRQHIRNGTCLIALDAMEEAPPEACVRLLDTLRKSPDLMHTRFLASMRNAAFMGIEELVVETEILRLLPFDTGQMRAALDAWFGEDRETANLVWEAIQDRMMGVLEAPLLLWIVSRLAETARQESRPMPRWERRVDLYRLFLENGLDRWARQPPHPEAFQKRIFLAFAADVAQSLREGSVSDAWSRAEVEDAIAGTTREEFRALAGRSLLHDLVSTGILTRRAERRDGDIYAFTHATFGEYLVGYSLARTANAFGWSAIEKWVDTRAGAPAWQEAIVFLAALLNDPVPLLDLLSNSRRDDEIRTRLTLAAYCLPDVLAASSFSAP